MLKNFTTLSELQAFHPEINLYKWGNQGQLDFSEQIAMATSIVFSDLSRWGIPVKKLMRELVLRDSGTALSASATETDSFSDDQLNRLRFVVDCRVFTGDADKVVTLQGCNTIDGTFVDIATLNISATVVSSVLFYDTYTHYRVRTVLTTGTIDHKAYLVDTIHDALFYNATLELILRNVKKKPEDGFDVKAKEFKDNYNEALTLIRPIRI